MESSREKTIVRAGVVTVLANFFLAGLKAFIGVAANSLAIVSDATHGLIDAASGFIVIIGEKLAAHRKFTKNRAKIERATSLIISFIVIVVGIHILVESVEKLISPEAADYSPFTIIVLILSVFIKLGLGLYLKQKGQATRSGALVASSVEAINDSIISAAVLISAVIYLIWQVDIEAYVSLAISLLIIKFGLELIWPKFFKHHHLGAHHNHSTKSE